METISTLSYYFHLLATYTTYYSSYWRDLYRDYPYEVKTAIWVIQWALILIVILTIILEHRGHLRRKRERMEARLEERYGEALNHIFATDNDHQITRDEIISRFHLSSKEASKHGLLRDDGERRTMCRMIYHRLMNDETAGPNRQKNLQLLLDIFALPSFLEGEVSLGNMNNKMTAMTMIRAFRLYISPWVINKLLNSKQTQVRRLAMYSSVMSSSDSELEYFETDFFDKNCCIYDEIELGYTLHRRRAAGLKLPNLAHWAHLQKNDNTKCMFVRLMRRFDQHEYCHQLEDLFRESKHKKLIEEISRTWGYLHYTESEQLLVDTMLTQPDDTKVAIMHAVTRMASGQSLSLLLDGYENTTNPHVRFEALRCMYSYGQEGRDLLAHLESEAPEADHKFFSFFHNPITLNRIPLDKEQAYHPSVETVYNLSY
ncbi:MAG: hypothetical protein IJ064_04380 [Bacteroidaceae bacterium]|nr:hypothetical protein [Bacteroidaceae bacterium]